MARTESHEKSMGSYQLHAWRDAMAIASLLEQKVGLVNARKIYEKFPVDALISYESKIEDSLADFIERPESQRPGVLKKLPAGEATLVAFLTLAIIGCMRAKELFELRDAYRYSLVPGSGNRVTTAALYRFGQQARRIHPYTWPSEPILAMGFDDEDDDDDDGPDVNG